MPRRRAWRPRRCAARAAHRRFDSFCWGIEPWDAKKVEAELRKRGLTPVADNHGKDFQSFHVKDPDGFDLQISNGNRTNRRQGAGERQDVGAGAVRADRTGRPSGSITSRSRCRTTRRRVAFYTALLGWKPGTDEGSQNQCEIGDVGDIIIRRGGGGNRGAAPARDTAGARAPQWGTSRSASRRSIPIR